MRGGTRRPRSSADSRRAACRLLADAFADDPWAAHVLGTSGRERPAALARLMAVPVAVADERGGLVVETAAGGPVAVSTWVPAHSRGVGPVTAARAGALLLPLAVGPATMSRLTRDEAALERVLRRVTTSADAYLWVLGVARDRHGRGVGRVVVERTCAEAAAAGHRRLVLNTDNPSNVAIYRRLGFRPAVEETRPSGLTAHVLVRDLGPTGSGPTAAT